MPQQVACKRCTYLNNDRRSNCEMCNTALEKPINKVSISSSSLEISNKKSSLVRLPPSVDIQQIQNNGRGGDVINFVNENDPLPGWKKHLTIYLKSSVHPNTRGNVQIDYSVILLFYLAII